MPLPKYHFATHEAERLRHQSTTQVKCHCLAWFLLSMIFLACIAMALFYGGYLTPATWQYLEQKSGISDTLRARIQEQESLLQQREQQLTQQAEQLAIAQQELAIQKATSEGLRKQFALLETQVTDRQQKLLLYESILSPDDLQQGLQIRYFSIKPRTLDADGNTLEAGRFYQYHLVLANLRKDEIITKGFWELLILGKLRENNVKFTQADLTTAGQSINDVFSLKYYQSIEGNLMLPEGFRPKQVTIRLKPEGTKRAADYVTATYTWDSFKSPNNVFNVKE